MFNGEPSNKVDSVSGVYPMGGCDALLTLSFFSADWRYQAAARPTPDITTPDTGRCFVRRTESRFAPGRRKAISVQDWRRKCQRHVRYRPRSQYHWHEQSPGFAAR